LIAIVGGVIFRRVEADQQRRHWFRDQLRLAAEQFLADAAKHLALSRDRMQGDIHDTSAAHKQLFGALAIDIARLQLVAEKPVFESADKVATKLVAALEAANNVTGAHDTEHLKAALEGSLDAFGDTREFAELVKRHLN